MAYSKILRWQAAKCCSMKQRPAVTGCMFLQQEVAMYVKAGSFGPQASYAGRPASGVAWPWPMAPCSLA